MDVPKPPSRDAARLYCQYRPLLLITAWRRFGIPPKDAEDLVHDVFVSFLLHWESIENVRGWLVGAICHACRHRIRTLERLDQWEMRHHARSMAPAYVATSIAHELVGDLPVREKEILRLRFEEGLTIPEIGRRLECSTPAAGQRLRRALQHARDHGLRPRR